MAREAWRRLGLSHVGEQVLRAARGSRLGNVVQSPTVFRMAPLQKMGQPRTPVAAMLRSPGRQVGSWASTSMQDQEISDDLGGAYVPGPQIPARLHGGGKTSSKGLLGVLPVGRGPSITTVPWDHPPTPRQRASGSAWPGS